MITTTFFKAGTITRAKPAGEVLVIYKDEFEPCLYELLETKSLIEYERGFKVSWIITAK